MAKSANRVKKGKSLTSWVLGATVVSCVIMAAIAMVIGMSIYGTDLEREYISRATSVAKNAGASVLHGQPRTRGLADQVMGIYNSLTPEQQLKAVSDDPAERAEYRSYYAAVNTELQTGDIYDVLIHMLPGFGVDVDYIYLGMYDRENHRLVYIVDADRNEATQMMPGDWEEVSAEEANKFLDWKARTAIYHVSRSEKFGWLCTAGYPIQYENGITSCFCLVDVKMSNVARGLNEYAIKVFIPLLAATALLAWFMSRRIRQKVARPIDAIANAAQRYVQDRRAGSGVTDHFSSLNIHTGDELENLSVTMAEMEQQLTQHEEHITRITAEKERINSELSMASRIQASMLPDTFPAFPDRKEFDIFAAMDPAREVGGDFYDFFMIDGDHLGIVIADVSGKGVPAALYMMIAMNIIRSHSLMGESPEKVLADTNTALCSNNRMEMFVTAWVGVLEISTGRMVAASAGHEFPAVYSASAGKFELLKGKNGFVLGGIEGARYKEYSLTLQPGDKLFIYTDGVPEATDSSQTLFGTERMLASLNRAGGASPRATLETVRADVDAFVGKAEQFDDLTMLCLEYKGQQAQ